MDLSELQALRIQELSELAKSLNIADSISGLNKQELTVKILEAQAKKDGSVFAKGVLEVMHDGYGFLRSPDFNYLPGPDDIYVCLLYTSPSPRDGLLSRMPSSA